MLYNSKLENCYETVIAALAAHIERLEIDIEMKEQANARLREENLARENECVHLRERAGKLEEQLMKVKEFCADNAKNPLHEYKPRPSVFVDTAIARDALDAAARAIQEMTRKCTAYDDSEVDPFESDDES